MLTQVILQSSSPMTLDIGNADPMELLILESVSGLDPVDITLFTGDFAKENGYYQGRRAAKRNPIFNFKINPDYALDISVSDARELLYRTFLEPQALTDGLQVTLKDDKKPDRYFIGYTEKPSSEIFSQKPKAQFSMICVDSYLRSVDETTASDVAGWVSTSFDYEGSADTGIEVTLKVSTATPNVYFGLNGQFMHLFKSTGNFAVNDIIYINTKIGERAITVNGADKMVYLTDDSKWLSLNSTATTLSAHGGVAADGKVKAMDYTYRAAWWGV